MEMKGLEDGVDDSKGFLVVKKFGLNLDQLIECDVIKFGNVWLLIDGCGWKVKLDDKVECYFVV